MGCAEKTFSLVAQDGDIVKDPCMQRSLACSGNMLMDGRVRRRTLTHVQDTNVASAPCAKVVLTAVEQVQAPASALLQLRQDTDTDVEFPSNTCPCLQVLRGYQVGSSVDCVGTTSVKENSLWIKTGRPP